MSTPEDRLRQKAEQLRGEREQRERQDQEQSARDRADLQRRAQEASNEAQTWLKRAEELANATKVRIPIHLDFDLDEGPGFELRIGTAVIRAVLEPEGWRVTRFSPAEIGHVQSLPADLPSRRDVVVEQMVEQGLHDVMEGRVRPAPEWGR